jgi:4-amino-4-deoxy-L-arabinose transferase-like glycosyltransferase
LLLALLMLTAVLYLWDLGASGWANSFYSAAVQAGAKSWKAFFFGSFDASNFITVDKPPASLWVMDLSARIFGVNAWSILVPEALMGVATVAIVYATVRRWFTAGAGLLAGAVVALTPVAVLMFRFNNPDTLLVLLLTGAAYATTRAIEKASTRWLALAGALVGFGFLTKMIQAFLVVPAFALVYLLAAPTPFWRRVRQLAIAAAALVASGGWWVAIVEIWPAASRPYIGGSQNNNLLNLIFGYNGFGRLTGNETGSVTGGGIAAAGTGMWGSTGWSRLFNSQFGGQTAWLLPAAAGFFVVLLLMTWRSARHDRIKVATLLWGGSLFAMAAVISFSQGIIHPYYTVALAPGIGALVGIGVTTMWARRSHLAARAVLATVVAGTAIWSYVLLDRTPSWHPWVRVAVVVAAAAAVLGLLVGRRLGRIGLIGTAAVSVIAGLLGPGAYSIATAAEPHSGAIPSAGPTMTGAVGFGGAPGGGRGLAGGFPGSSTGRFPGSSTGRFPGSSTGRFPGAFSGRQGTGALPQGLTVPGRNGQVRPSGTGFGGVGDTQSQLPRIGGFGGVGGGGGLLGSTQPSTAVVRSLEKNASRYTWVAAAVGANNAAGYQLATDDPVMALGGFNGSDPAPTLGQFEADVKAGKVHYFIASGGTGVANGGGSDAQQITTWVESHFKSTSIGGVTLYDLTTSNSSSLSS